MKGNNNIPSDHKSKQIYIYMQIYTRVYIYITYV